MYYGFLGEAPKVVGVVSDYVKRGRQCEAELGGGCHVKSV